MITRGGSIRNDSQYLVSNSKFLLALLCSNLRQVSPPERQGTGKTSFLFFGKDAGTLDLDSIYWISLNGLEELISMDPSFNKYTNARLMECYLLYYKTNLFARVVQILRLEDHASLWSWLSPIQKEGTPLSRLSLIQHCLSDGPFLSFICNMVLSSLSEEGGSSSDNSRRVLISFYATMYM